jgi:hypothetical protein
MVDRRRLGAMLAKGGELGNFVAGLQSDSNASTKLNEIQEEAKCIGAGGTWDKTTQTCSDVGRPPTNTGLGNRVIKGI